MQTKDIELGSMPPQMTVSMEEPAAEPETFLGFEVKREKNVDGWYIGERMFHEPQLELPLQESMTNAEGEHMAPAMGRDVTDVPIEEVRPCFASCCYICSLFCGFPSCIGFNGSQVLLIFGCKYVCCKLLDCNNEDRKCFNCCKCDCFLSAPTKFFECEGQYCCMDVKAAFPCTVKVPCIVTCCMVTCFADYKFLGCKPCQKAGELIPRLNERAGKATASGEGSQ